MENYSNFVTLGLITLTFHVSSVVSQSWHDCDRYCSAKCFDINTYEFSSCVFPNSHCFCDIRDTLRKFPTMFFLPFFLIWCAIVTLICCWRIREAACNGRRTSIQRIITEPVVRSHEINSSSEGISNAYTQTTNSNFQLLFHYPLPYTPNRGIASHLVPPVDLNNVPGEYLGPSPACNTCVADRNSTSRTENTVDSRSTWI